MSDKQSAMRPEAGLMRLNYYGDRPHDSTNLDTVIPDWTIKLGITHAQSASFLRTRKLYRREDPAMPTMPADRDSLEYKVEERRFLEKVSLTEKENAACEREDAKIFSTMLAALSSAAKAQCAKHKDWEDLTRAGKDPLRALEIMCEMLVSVGKAGSDRARQDVVRSIANMTQTKYYTLDEFYRLFKARHERLDGMRIPRATPLGATAIAQAAADQAEKDTDQAADFLEKLANRYSELRRFIANGVLPAPKNLQEAYEMAANFQVSVGGNQSQLASAYSVSTAGNRKSNRDKKSRSKSPRRSRSKSPQQGGNKAPHSTKKEKKEHEDERKEKPKARGGGGGGGVKSVTCYICGNRGHISKHCPDRKHVEGEEDANDAEESGSDDSDDESANIFCLCVGGDTSCMPEEEALAAREALVSGFLPTELGFDTMCSKNVVGNPALLTNLRKCKAKKFKGVGGYKTATMIGDLADFGTAYYIPGVPNLLSFFEVAQRDGVLIEYSSRDRGFHVSLGESSYFFEGRPDRRVYTCDLGARENSEADSAYGIGTVETVEGNERLYTKEQVRAAKRAGAFVRAMGFSSAKNTLRLAKTGRVDGINFTPDDVERAREIYGEDVESVRGKTPRLKRGAAKYEGRPHGKMVDSDVTMHLDIMFLSGVAFLLSYTRPLMMLMTTWIKSRKVKDVAAAITGQKNKLVGAGFKVTQMTADGEGAIGALQTGLRGEGCEVDVHGTQTFSAEIDVKTKQIKNCVRSITSLPYSFPLMLLCWAVYFAVSKINMLPTSTSDHSFSPFEMFTGRSISLSRDLGARRGGLPLGFGSYCEVFEKTDNTVHDRTRASIFLGTVGNVFGTTLHFVLDTQQVVKRDQWKSLPMGPSVIRKMNEICKSSGGALPKNPSVYIGNREILEGDTEEADIWDISPPRTRLVADNGADLPGWTEGVADTGEEVRDELRRADDVPPEEDDVGAMEIPADATDAEELRIPAEDGGTRDGPSESYDERVEEHPRWSHPTPVDRVKGSRADMPGTPWFQQGAPVVQPESGRAKRVTKPVEKYGYSAFWTQHEASPQAADLTREKRTRHTFRPSKSGVNRVQHARAETSREKHHSAYNMTIMKALKTFGKKANSSMLKEMLSIDEKGVLKQVRVRDLTSKQIKKIIRSKMFLKEKYLSTGEFEKLKARFVAGGHLQDRSLYSDGETSSPTVSLQSIYLVSSIAAREKRKVVTLDIGTAYLNADIKKEVLMRVEPKLAEILHQIDPKRYLPEEDGSMVVQLLKALYGCVESARLWFDMLSGVVTNLGFIPNGKDPCVFNMMKDGKQITVAVYVDDLMCTCENEANLEWFVQALTSEFKTVTVNRGVVHSYLGETFDFSVAGEVSISMEGYIMDVLALYDVKGERATPAREDLFAVNEEAAVLSPDKAEQFHSRVMKLMYLAQRARPDILTAMNFLSTRVTKSTEEDWEKLDRALMYLRATADIKLRLKSSDAFQVLAYVDASFAVHPGAKSQSGLVISLGQGTVCASSKKQKLVGKSSTEAELIGVSDMLPQVIWTREFFVEQGYDVKPLLLQDNKSCISLIEKGRSTSARTRHIAIRFFFVKDRVDAGELSIAYEPTETMVADCMTKPLQGHLFKEMREWLMGWKALAPRGVKDL